MAKTPAKKSAHARTNSGENELVFVALGGLGEIGMNNYLYGIGPPDRRQWLMVDCGLTFPGEAEPGVDVVLPDLRFIEGEADRLCGILITHAHEDHIGAVIDMWPRLKAPVYASPFTAGMLKAKLAEFGGRLQIPLNVVPMGHRFEIGPFDVELVTMAHSIPEPSGVMIRTPVGKVFHTSDWKIDATPLVGPPTNEQRLRALGAEGVDALICNSTNALREGISPSETAIAQSLTEIVKAAPNRVAITTFASNVARVKAVADAARASGRHLVVAGRAMHRVIDVAIDTGYLPEDFRYLDQDQFKYIDRSDVLLLCTGSQGEGRAALARIGEDDHPSIELASGDLVIFSSRSIPGNEKSIGRVMNNLSNLGCEILTDAEALVHVTGHPRREELRQMYAWLAPKLLVPMHGEARHLKAQAKLGREAGIPAVLSPQDGQMIRLAPAPARHIDEVPTGRLYRDGKLVVESEEGPVRERRKLSMVGIVVVALTLSRRSEFVGEPMVAIDGVPHETAEGEDMEDVVLDAVEGTLKSIPAQRRKSDDLVTEAIRRAVRAAVDREWGKRPIVKVLLNRSEDAQG